MSRLAIRLAPVLAGIAVIFAVASALAQFTWTLAGEPARTTHHAAEDRLELNGKAAAPADVDAIIALAPFGTPVSLGSTAFGGGQSSVKLTLEGVVVAADASRSQAIILAEGGKAESYLPGEALPGGAILVRVGKQEVVLRISGREEILSFPAQTHPGNLAGRVLGQGTDAATGTTPIDEVVARARQRIAQNPKTLLTELGVQDEPDGYRIGSAASAMTRRAGFKPGDIITRVNGVAVGNIENDRRLFEDVVASGRARVELLRNGRLTILTFPLR